jgi:hypothetical protein
MRRLSIRRASLAGLGCWTDQQVETAADEGGSDAEPNDGAGDDAAEEDALGDGPLP